MSTIKEILGKKGKKYQATIRLKGYKPLYKTFDSKTTAKEWAKEIEVQMKKGTWCKANIEVVSPIVSVEQLIRYFQKNEAPKRYSKHYQYDFMYEWWIEKIGHLNISDVTPNVLVRCKNILMSEPPDKPYKNHTLKSNSTVRKYMFCLSAVFKYAVRELGIIQINPMSNVDKPKKSKGVVRFLSDEERTALIRAAKENSDILYLFVILGIFSGGRYSEILTLSVENIDFQNEMIYYLETKNGESRGVPIYHRVMEIIKEYLEKHNIKSGYIFLNQKTKKLPYLKGQFENLVKETGINNFRLHDMRHSYGSYLAQNGAELLEIAQLMGHKNLQQVQIYAHLTQKHTAKVVRKMSANVWDFE
ncbi:tyrosine-type recombinase/integrase [bacterium]|nr:tyrosine-type recombinase/integrase [bacterium]